MKTGIFCLHSLVFVFFLFASSLAQAKPWSELEVGEKYAFQENVRIEDSENPSNYFEALPGTTVELIEVMSLGSIDVGLWRFLTNCRYSSSQIPLTLHESPFHNIQVGLALEPGCILEVYVDLYDYYKESLF